MFSAWLLSLVGIVVIGVLADIILPDGEMSKYVKGIMAVFTVFVIVSPLPNLLNAGSVDINTSVDFKDYDYDAEYVEYITELRRLSYEKTAKREIESKTGFACEVTINETEGVVEKIIVDFSKTVMFENEKHIFIIETTAEYLTTYFKINSEQIEFVWKQ